MRQEVVFKQLSTHTFFFSKHKYLVRASTDVVAWGIVMVNDKPPPIGALNPSASETDRVALDHLCVI